MKEHQKSKKKENGKKSRNLKDRSSPHKRPKEANTQCAKDCGPYNLACKYGQARLRGSQSLVHAVVLFEF